MCLTETMQRFLQTCEVQKDRLDPDTREYVIMSCRVMYLRNLLTILICEPPDEDIIHVRKEFQRMFHNKDFVGNGHQHVVDEWDRGNHDLLF